MTKVERARIILGQILSLESRIGVTADNEGHDLLARRRTIKIENRWLATVRRSELRETDAPAHQWDQLHLEVAGALKLALRFLDNQVDIILFDPGTWEMWFNTYDPADTDLVRP